MEGDMEKNDDRAPLANRRSFDCLILSGGGAKGSFGAGASRAILAYRDLRGRAENDICYLGTSAGALNAAMLAAWGKEGPQRLHALWSTVTAEKLLGTTPGPKKTLARLVMRTVTHPTNFSVFDADGLKSLVGDALRGLNFEEFRNRAHLIVVAADYTEGRLVRFYSSSLVDELVEKDRRAAEALSARRKLNRFKRIESAEMLIECLLASAAIPLIFPLVSVDGHWHADGGIGNNTPVQEAALLMRAVNELTSTFRSGDSFCVLQHPSQTAARLDKRSFWEIAAATYELAHELHMGPIIGSWLQINGSLTDHQRNVNAFLDEIAKMELSDADKGKLRSLTDKHLVRLGGHAPRLVLPLHEIRPSGDLGNLLKFDAPQSHDAEGYTAAVEMLSTKQLIEPHEKESLNAKLLNGLGGKGHT